MEIMAAENLVMVHNYLTKADQIRSAVLEQRIEKSYSELRHSFNIYSIAANIGLLGGWTNCSFTKPNTIVNFVKKLA